MSQEIKERLRNAPLWNGSTLHAEAADHIEALEQQLADLRQAPDGFAIVPLEPTPEMIEAGNNNRPYKEDDGDAHLLSVNTECTWAAMIAAAPSAGLAMLRDDRREG